jgi:hypothetical protein
MYITNKKIMSLRNTTPKGEEIQKRKVMAYDYYNKGLTLDEIGHLLGRSREWSRWAINQIKKERQRVEQ